MIASTGEQVTIGLLSMALKDISVDAVSYTGWQGQVLTDSASARRVSSRSCDSQHAGDLDAGRVVVVAGFRVDESGSPDHAGPWRLGHFRPWRLPPR